MALDGTTNELPRDTRSMASMLQGTGLALSIASTLTLSAGIVQAMTVYEGRGGLSDRLELLSQVVGSPFGALLALGSVLALLAARNSDGATRRNFDVAIVLLAAASSIVVLFGGAFGAVRTLFDSHAGGITGMTASDTSARVASVFQYAAAVVVSGAAFRICVSIRQEMGRGSDADGALADGDMEESQPTA